jgi:diguanylate cyclase (GGDEF)-like protein
LPAAAAPKDTLSHAVSFRRRLFVAVLLILVVPMAAIVLLLVRLGDESRTGKADARLAGALPFAVSIYRDDTAAARRVALDLGAGARLGGALAAGGARLRAEIPRLARGRDLRLLSASCPDEGPVSFRRGAAVAVAAVTVSGLPGGPCRVSASTTSAAHYAAQVAGDGTLGVAVARGGEVIATSGSGFENLEPTTEVPRSEDVELPDGAGRARVVGLPGSGGDLRLVLAAPREGALLSSGRALIAVAVAALLLAALGLIVPLLRDLQRLHDRVAGQAITDGLTGLSNQRRFRQTIAKEVERARRFERPLSLLMLDLDDFKRINDTHGHLQGDQVLKEIARVLTQESRGVDEPARYGGEEFAIALPETGIEGAMEMAERLRARIERTSIRLEDGRGDPLRITVSIGVAGTPEQEPDPQGLLAAADEALYRAKAAGKNRVGRASERPNPSRETA